MSTDSIANDCLVHYNSQHIQVRKDFFDLCAYDKSLYNTKRNEKGNIIKDEPNQECMAKLLRLFETLTNTRKAEWHLSEKGRQAMGMAPSDEPEEYPIKLAYSVIVELLFHTYGESTVRNSLAVLIGWEYLKRYQKNKGSTPFYILNIPVLQAVLQKQAEKPGQAKKKRVLNSTPRAVKVTPPSSNSTPRGVNSIPNKKVGNTSSKITTDKKGDSNANQELTNSNSKPTPPAPNKNLNEKVEQFRNTFIALGREYFAYDKFTTNRVQPNSEVYTRILEIIGDGEVNQQAMRTAFLKLWNHKDRDGTYWWQDKNKLTLKAYVNNYDDQDTRQPTDDSVTSNDPLYDLLAAQESARRAKRHRERFISDGPLAGQPDFDSDPWT